MHIVALERALHCVLCVAILCAKEGSPSHALGQQLYCVFRILRTAMSGMCLWSTNRTAYSVSVFRMVRPLSNAAYCVLRIRILHIGISHLGVGTVLRIPYPRSVGQHHGQPFGR